MAKTKGKATAPAADLVDARLAELANTFKGMLAKGPAHRYVVIGTELTRANADDDAGSQGSGDPGKTGSGIPSEPNPYLGRGYYTVQGSFAPRGLGAIEFATHEHAFSWLEMPEGQLFKKTYKNVVVACVFA